MAEKEVADQGFAADHELIRQTEPGTDRDFAGGDVFAKNVLLLWADFEIVAKRDRLGVHVEVEEAGFLLEDIEEHIDEVNQHVAGALG